MSSRRRLIASGLVILLGGGAYLGVTAATRRRLTSGVPTGPEIHEVRVEELHSNSAMLEKSFTGVVRARHESDLSFRVGGKVVARLVEVGDRVRAGQVLARLDPGDLDLSVREAEADLSATEASLRQISLDDERAKQLFAENAIPRAELDRVNAERDTAEARRDRARAGERLASNHLAYCTLKADADGAVTGLAFEVGQVVGEGQVVAHVARAGELEAVVSVPENRVPSVRAGAATVTFWSLPGSARGALLREISPSADPVTRTYQARFTIAQAGPDIALGMTATVRVSSSSAGPSYAVPMTALLQREDRPAVWIVDRSTRKLASRSVEIIQYRQDTALVRGDVKDGDLVVTAGVQKLDPAMNVVPWQPPL